MVKGVTKQVVLVRPKDGDAFEQAIFFVKEGARSVSQEELLRQAKDAARGQPRQKGRWKRPASFLGGAVSVGLFWFLTNLV